MASYKRIRRELKDYQMSCSPDQSSGITIETIDDKLYNLRGQIDGPSGTPYAGGKFWLAIQIPENYPFNPPKVNFTTRIWHPNISSVTGAICLDILKDQWAAAMTIRTTLLSIQALLAAPFPDDPQDAVVAKQYQTNQEMFKSTAQHWTAFFAQGPTPIPDFAEKIAFMVDAGVDKNAAISVLAKNNWDLEFSMSDLMDTIPTSFV